MTKAARLRAEHNKKQLEAVGYVYGAVCIASTMILVD